jgi:hypothetical protein
VEADRLVDAVEDAWFEEIPALRPPLVAGRFLGYGWLLVDEGTVRDAILKAVVHTAINIENLNLAM